MVGRVRNKKHVLTGPGTEPRQQGQHGLCRVEVGEVGVVRGINMESRYTSQSMCVRPAGRASLSS